MPGPTIVEAPIPVRHVSACTAKVIQIPWAAGQAVALEHVDEQQAQCDADRNFHPLHLAQLPESYQWMEQLGPAKSLFNAALGKFNRFADRVTAKVLTGLDHLPDPAQLLLSQPMAQRYLYRDRTNLNAALGLIYEDFSDALASVSVPTHIIWGGQDSVTPLRTGQLLASRMQNAQLHVIAGAGHVPMADTPQQLLAVLQQALQQLWLPSWQLAWSRLALQQP